MGRRNGYRILVGKPKGEKPLRIRRRRSWNSLKRDLRVNDKVLWTGFIWLIRPRGGSCKHRNELNWWKFLNIWTTGGFKSKSHISRFSWFDRSKFDYNFLLPFSGLIILRSLVVTVAPFSEDTSCTTCKVCSYQKVPIQTATEELWHNPNLWRACFSPHIYSNRNSVNTKWHGKEWVPKLIVWVCFWPWHCVRNRWTLSVEVVLFRKDGGSPGTEGARTDKERAQQSRENTWDAPWPSFVAHANIKVYLCIETNS
jgi:hypothetical protein